jgi:hypothetical protein
MAMIELLIKYLFFIKSIYKKKKYANENGYLLGFFLLLINLHSILVVVDIYVDSFDFISFWRPNGTYKGIYGYGFGIIIAIILLSLISFFKKKTPFIDRVRLYRKAIIKPINKNYAIFYVVISVLFFFFSIFLLAKHFFG